MWNFGGVGMGLPTLLGLSRVWVFLGAVLDLVTEGAAVATADREVEVVN